MARLLQHPEAEDEAIVALKWYVARSRKKALRFDAKLDGVMREIRTQPDRYPYCDAEFREAGVPDFPYSLIYRVLASGDVQVIAVAHASREPGYWRDRVSTTDEARYRTGATPELKPKGRTLKIISRIRMISSVPIRPDGP